MLDLEFERDLNSSIHKWIEWRDSRIRMIAYFKWEESGKPEHESERFWFEAETEWHNNGIDIEVPFKGG